ncbi:MAG TPA: hypothetical protein VFZ34_24140 [Blastocatellia bacterium]|nr:hypothetical protein [Blastocatellia bacterium]
MQQAQYVAPNFNKTVNYAYKATGALHSLGTNLIGSDANATSNVISGMRYRAFGAASSISYGNNRKATLTNNSDLMRLMQMEVARPDGTEKIMSHTYGYVANGLLSSVGNVLDSAYDFSYQYYYRN